MSSDIIRTLDSFGIPKGSEKIIAFLQLLNCVKTNYDRYIVDTPSILYIPTVNVKPEEIGNSKFLKLAKSGSIGVLARDDKYGKLFLEMARLVIDQDYERLEKYKSIISRRPEDHSKKYPNAPPYFGKYQLKTLMNCISNIWSGRGYGYVDYSLNENFPAYLYSKNENTTIQILNLDTIMSMFMKLFRECIQIKFNLSHDVINEFKNFDNSNDDNYNNDKYDFFDMISYGISSLINSMVNVFTPEFV